MSTDVDLIPYQPHDPFHPSKRIPSAFEITRDKTKQLVSKSTSTVAQRLNLPSTSVIKTGLGYSALRDVSAFGNGLGQEVI